MAVTRLIQLATPRRAWALPRLIGTIVIAVTIVATGCGKSGASAPPPAATTNGETDTPAVPTQVVEIGGETFKLELALDQASRFQGLSDRKQIAEDGGMLFVFPRPQEAEFVMRRCYVPIDLIYLDAAGYIDSMHRMQVIEPVGGAEWTQPTSGYSSDGQVQFVVELKGGTLDQLGLRVGQKIDLPKRELMQRAQ